MIWNFMIAMTFLDYGMLISLLDSHLSLLAFLHFSLSVLMFSILWTELVADNVLQKL